MFDLCVKCEYCWFVVHFVYFIGLSVYAFDSLCLRVKVVWLPYFFRVILLKSHKSIRQSDSAPVGLVSVYAAVLNLYCHLLSHFKYTPFLHPISRQHVQTTHGIGNICKDLVKIGHAVPEICSQTNRHTYIHYMHIRLLTFGNQGLDYTHTHTPCIHTYINRK